MPKTMTAVLTCAALGLPLVAAAGGLKLPPEPAYLVGGTKRAPSAAMRETVRRMAASPWRIGHLSRCHWSFHSRLINPRPQVTSA